MLDLSSKSLGLWAGLGTAAFVGYCIYFDSKRRSHPDFKRKLREKRKAASKGQSKSAGPQLPDFSDQEAVQRFFLQEVQMGEELLATGDIQNGKLPTCWQKCNMIFKSVQEWNTYPSLWQSVANLTLSSPFSSKPFHHRSTSFCSRTWYGRHLIQISWDEFLVTVWTAFCSRMLPSRK